MNFSDKSNARFLMDRERITIYGKCPVCKKPFELGEIVVSAYIVSEDRIRPVHPHEAEYDPQLNFYVVRNT